MLFRANRAGYDVNTEIFECINLKTEEVQCVYLTIEELRRLNNLQLKSENAQVRDLFLIGCFTAMRYSDYTNLTEENFAGGKIRKLTKKTDTRVVLPIHPIIASILQRNKGYSFLEYKKSSQNFNCILKRLCRRAGITEKVYKEYTGGFKKVRKSYKKYELVSSHTARRSAATNMYLAGIPVFRIMLLTGHKTEEAFFRYIQIRKEENAVVLSLHEYFLCE